MKKILSLLLVLTMVFSLAACGGNNNVEETTPATEAPTDAPVALPVSALALLEELWNAQEEKFPVFGGDAMNMVSDAPGAYGLEDTETLAVQLLVPAEQAGLIDEAASLFHGMMLNNFTCGTFHTTDAETLQVRRNQVTYMLSSCRTPASRWSLRARQNNHLNRDSGP